MRMSNSPLSAPIELTMHTTDPGIPPVAAVNIDRSSSDTPPASSGRSQSAIDMTMCAGSRASGSGGRVVSAVATAGNAAERAGGTNI